MTQTSMRSRSRHQVVSQSATSSPSNSQQTAQQAGAQQNEQPEGRWSKWKDRLGFFDYTSPHYGPDRKQDFQRGKTFWDWLQLLGVLAIPLVVVLATILFGIQQANLAQQQHNVDQQLAIKQHESDQKLAQDQQHQTALATYLDHMSSLLPALLTSKEGDGTRTAARAQTLAVLLQLDPPRKKIVVMFLYQAGLINVKRDTSEIFRPYPPSTILQLDSADLSGVNLSGVDVHGISLGGVNLSHAVLSKALLYESNLYSADLSEASLEGANLNGSFLDSADLSEANLTNAMVQGDLAKADLSGAQLRGASLKGATLTGIHHLDRADLRGAKYNTIVVHQTVNGVTSDLQPTQWPQGFDRKAAGDAGAIVDNQDENTP